MPQRRGGDQAEPTVQLPVQKGHEEGEELPADLLGELSDVTRFVLFTKTKEKVFLFVCLFFLLCIFRAAESRGIFKKLAINQPLTIL